MKIYISSCVNLPNLGNNHLTQLPPEIKELKNLISLDLSNNQLTQLPPEIGEITNLKVLYLFNNKLTELPREIGGLKNLTELYIYSNYLIRLPSEIGELKNLKIFYLYGNKLTELPREISGLDNLIELNLHNNQLIQLPPEIRGLKNITQLYISSNRLTFLPPEIGDLKHLRKLQVYNNPLLSPPLEIISMGIEAIFTYLKNLKQSKFTENNEAKLILVGNGDVGKTCLVNRLVTNKFKEDPITEGINISKWRVSAPDSENSEIKLNIWDFGGQEIYHATHQFFLTKRSVYLLVWNARKAKDYDNIYYWLHTVEAFGEDSPIILVMSKMNENDDDLNIKNLKNKFPQIKGYLKIDSKDGKGIPNLIEYITDIAWKLPLMRTQWVDSWYKVREKLEGHKEYWISYEEFYNICLSEGLDDKSIEVLDEYLHELGVTLHFKDRISLDNIVILKPDWATGAFYKILSTQSVLHREGVLLNSELHQIWDKEIYPPSVYPQLMELMNKFELSYELPDKSSYLVPELLPKSAPDFKWDKKDNLCFYYCYDYFVPPGIIPRFIVRMHPNVEKKENGMPFCWREGALLKIEDSIALVEMKPDEKIIEIRVKGKNRREALGPIFAHLDQINSSIKKVNVSKQIPCNCSPSCHERYSYENLLIAEKNGKKTIQCHKSYENVQISYLLDGYKRKEEVSKESNESLNKTYIEIINQPKTHFEANQVTQVEQRTDVRINVDINLEIDLPQIKKDFYKLRKEVNNLNPELESELDKIQDSLDEISANSKEEKMNRPFNKLYRFLDELSDPNSKYSKVITGTQKGIELVQKIGRNYNKFAKMLAIPQVPELLLGK